MKGATRSVRIGFVQRATVSQEPNAYQLPPKVQGITVEQQPNYQSVHQQVGRTGWTCKSLEKQISTPRTQRNVSPHDINEINNSNPPYSNISSLPSSLLPSSIGKQTTTTNLLEIQTKTKWSTRKIVLVGLSAFALLSILIIVPTVLGVLLTRSTTTSTTPATTTSQTIVSASWSFDNTTTDLYGVYNGQLLNGATYSANSSSQPYIGYGRALSLNLSSNQSFLVPTPFLDLAYTSFTVEAWIYLLTSYTGDRGVFGQCQCLTCANQCLYLIVRGGHLYMSFTLNDLSGSLPLIASTWYHIAFVYNYQTQQQILYLNGAQDTIKSNAQPYQGTNGSIQIGSTQVFLTTNYFNGYIDNLKVITRAKSSTEILIDASLTAYYSFDLPYPTNDNGPNGFNGTSVNTVTVTGRVNQAMRFTGSSSYFQAYGFYQIPYGVTSGKPFSVSMWINPTSLTSCTFVQVQGGTFCMNMLGISAAGSSGQITAQGYGFFINGPFLTLNTWTHISWTFSSINGYTLYVNGNLFGTTGASSYSISTQLAWLYIGYGFSCASYFSCYASASPYTYPNYISNSAYQGSIDEIYIHSRELAQADVTALANP